MNYPPGVTGLEPYFDPPDEPEPLGECGGRCGKLVIEGEDWIDRGGVLWHDDCLPDDPPRTPRRPPPGTPVSQSDAAINAARVPCDRCGEPVHPYARSACPCRR